MPARQRALDALRADDSRRLYGVPADDSLVLQGLLPPREGETIEDVRARVVAIEERDRAS